MKLIASLITGLSLVVPLAASAAPMKVLDYEARTHVFTGWQKPENRALIEARIKLAQSYIERGVLTLNDSAFSANKVEVQKGTDSFLCASGVKEACRVKSAR